MLTFSYDTIDSTSDQAKQLVAENPGQIILVTSDRQTAGRGRSGRVWRSPAGGAWFSMAWPMRVEPQRYNSVPLLAGKAVLDSVKAILGPAARVQIKWPNDVLVEDKKVAGVLCERVLGGRAGARGLPATLVVGVGINTNFNSDRLGDDLRRSAGTLSEFTGGCVDVTDLIRGCAARIERLITRLELERSEMGSAFFARLETNLAWVGHAVSLHVGDRVVTGLCVGLDGAGRLRLEVSGREEVFDAGEVSHVRTMSAMIHQQLAR